MDKQPPKSSFLRFALGFTLCSLILCGGFTAFIFGTDAVVDTTLMNVADLYKTNNNAKISVATKNTGEASAGDVTQSGANIPGLDGYTGPVDVDIGSLVDSEIVASLTSAGFGDKADTLSAIFTRFAPEVGANGAIGIMANVNHEGNFGLVQYGKTVPNWSGGQSFTSSASNPLIVTTTENINAIRALGHYGNSVGVGIVQWTYYTYMGPLADTYEKYCVNGVLSGTARAQAELEFLAINVAANKSSLTGSAYDCCKNWLLNFERPQNAQDKINERCATAVKIFNALLVDGIITQ